MPPELAYHLTEAIARKPVSGRKFEVRVPSCLGIAACSVCPRVLKAQNPTQALSRAVNTVYWWY